LPKHTTKAGCLKRRTSSFLSPVQMYDIYGNTFCIPNSFSFEYK
jgi:hypothetical protein